jgi:hypothetical protein
VNTLLYYLGEEAEVLSTSISDESWKKYPNVITSSRNISKHEGM